MRNTILWKCNKFPGDTVSPGNLSYLTVGNTEYRRRALTILVLLVILLLKKEWQLALYFH